MAASLAAGAIVFLAVLGTWASFERLGERTRQVSQSNVYAARSVAAAVAGQLQDLRSVVVLAAAETELGEMLARKDGDCLEEFVKASGRGFGELSASWLVIDAEGTMWVGLLDPAELDPKWLKQVKAVGALDKGPDSRPQHSSPVRCTRVGEGYRFWTAEPVYAPGAPDRLLGVVAASITTTSTLGKLLPPEARIALVGPAGGSGLELVSHPGFPLGDKAVNVDNKILSDVRDGLIDPAGAFDDSFIDPVGELRDGDEEDNKKKPRLYPHYAGRRIAGFAPAADTGFVVIAQQSYNEAVQPYTELVSWYRIVPPLAAVMLALITGRLFLSLLAGVAAGGLLSAAGNYSGVFSWFGRGIRQGGEFVVQTVHDCKGFGWDNPNWDNLGILLFVTLLMPIINVMIVGGGLQGVATWLLRWAKSARSTRLVTMISGLVIFIDDYANTLIVGPTMRPLTDRQLISREKLAFLVDATAAPVAGIALVSTWIGYEVGLLSELGVGEGGYAVFLNALAFRFYCFGMIAFVFWNCYSGQDFGPMAAAERRARAGKVLADDAVPMASKSMNAARPHPQARIRALVAIVPMAVLLVVFLGQFWLAEEGRGLLKSDPGAIVRFSGWTEAMSGADSIPLLARAAGVALMVAIALALGVSRIPVGALGRAIVVGLKSSLMPVTVLMLAWSLKGACTELQTGEFLANVLGDSIPRWMFPGLVFVVAALTSFATGTSYGTMAILIPTAVPVALELDGGYGLITMISIGAVLDGAIFGDHCSPISDTTIMSSIASSCDHVHHVRTQLPYCVVVAVLALCVGYLPAAMGVPPWIGVAAGAAISGLVFLCLRIFRPADQRTN